MAQNGDKLKVIVVMPAYNAAKTLRLTYEAIPKKDIAQIILVDEDSHDETLKIAKELNLEVFVHARNFGVATRKPAIRKRSRQTRTSSLCYIRTISMIPRFYPILSLLLSCLRQNGVRGRALLVEF
jgi:hypothetical protein